MVGFNKQQSLILTGGIALLTMAGCDGRADFQRAAVRGTVSLDGEPLEHGVVRFVPLDKTPGRKQSVSLTNGQFSMDEELGPAVGRHRIEIESTDTGGLELDDEDAMTRLHSEGVQRIDVQRVPPWYNRASRIVEEIKDGDNAFSFELSSKRQL